MYLKLLDSSKDLLNTDRNAVNALAPELQDSRWRRDRNEDIAGNRRKNRLFFSNAENRKWEDQTRANQQNRLWNRESFTRGNKS